eukprot:10096780-Heterocapsa_arctica.AAC.1
MEVQDTMDRPIASKQRNATQRKTGTADVGVWMEDTMDRPNDPGGSSSTIPPIIIIPDIPT